MDGRKKGSIKRLEKIVRVLHSEEELYQTKKWRLEDAIEAAVSQVLKDGYRTGDIMSDGCTKVGTARMGDLICERIR